MTKTQRTRAFDRITGWIERHCATARGLTVSLSFGSDSTLAFAACASVYPGKTLGVHIGRRVLHEDYFRSLNGKITCVPAVRTTRLEPEAMRWALLFSMSKEIRYWPVSSRNRTEQVMGLFSIPSNQASIFPLVHLWKTDIMELCQHIGVPAVIMEGSRKADPNCGRPAEIAEIGLELVDFYAQCREQKQTRMLRKNLAPAQIRYLNGVYEYNNFKRHTLVGLQS